MTRQKLSMSEKIRNQLALGKTPKEISKYLKCSTGLVYAVRASDKKKEAKKPLSVNYAVRASDKKKEAEKPLSVKEAQKVMQESVLNALATKPGAIRYGDSVLVPKDYTLPKRNIVQRLFNWICGG